MKTNFTQTNASYDAFFLYVQFATLSFAGVELVTAWLFGSPTLGLTAAITASLGLMFALARELLHRERPIAALSVAGLSASALALLYMLPLPELIAGFMLFPMATIGLAMLSRSRRLFMSAVAVALGTVLLLIVLSFAPRLFAPAPASVLILLQFTTPVVVTALVGLLFGYTWNNLNLLLQTSQATNRELAALRDSLEEQVSRRTSELQAALSQVQAQSAAQACLLQENALQRQTISDLGVPVLPISATTMVVPLVGLIDQARLDLLRERALGAIEQRRARTLLLDLTGVELLDEVGAQGVLDLVQGARLLGAQTVLIGIRPEVAEAMVALGIALNGLNSMPDLQSALAALKA